MDKFTFRRISMITGKWLVIGIMALFALFCFIEVLVVVVMEWLELSK
ncbi:hypothetical protein [Gorillibacterium massiliense]|nr:hypothetical protein [Gorillibacterium massiliense]